MVSAATRTRLPFCVTLFWTRSERFECPLLGDLAGAHARSLFRFQREGRTEIRAGSGFDHASQDVHLRNLLQ